MLLDEYIAVFYPHGPLTTNSLRTEIRKGTLTPAQVAGKFYITPAKVRAMFKAAECPVKPKAPGSTFDRAALSPAPESAGSPSGSSVMDRLRSARAVIETSLTPQGETSPPTSRRNGRRSQVITLATHLRS
jgi:hypothetical protein